MSIRGRVMMVAAAAALGSTILPIQTHATARPPAEGEAAGSFSPLFARRLSVGIQDMDPPDDRLATERMKRDPLATPASANPVSLCLGSFCLGSWCLGSACVNSGCLGSACLNSTCTGSACLGTTCGGSACVGSICGGSACVGSTCTTCSPSRSHEIEVMG